MSESKKSIKPINPGRLKTIRSDSDFSNLVYGKIQPQAIPLEEAVLGTCGTAHSTIHHFEDHFLFFDTEAALKISKLTMNIRPKVLFYKCGATFRPEKPKKPHK